MAFNWLHRQYQKCGEFINRMHHSSLAGAKYYLLVLMTTYQPCMPGQYIHTNAHFSRQLIHNYGVGGAYFHIEIKLAWRRLVVIRSLCCVCVCVWEGEKNTIINLPHPHHRSLLPLTSLPLTFIFTELCKFTLGPLAGLGVRGVPEGIVRVVLEGNATCRRPLGMLLTKTLQKEELISAPCISRFNTHKT